MEDGNPRCSGSDPQLGWQTFATVSCGRATQAAFARLLSDLDLAADVAQRLHNVRICRSARDDGVNVADRT